MSDSRWDSALPARASHLLTDQRPPTKVTKGLGALSRPPPISGERHGRSTFNVLDTEEQGSWGVCKPALRAALLSPRNVKGGGLRQEKGPQRTTSPVQTASKSHPTSGRKQPGLSVPPAPGPSRLGPAGTPPPAPAAGPTPASPLIPSFQASESRPCPVAA